MNTFTKTEDGTAPTLDEALTRIHNFFKNFQSFMQYELLECFRTKTVKFRKAELGLLFDWHMDRRSVHILRNMAVHLNARFNL